MHEDVFPSADAQAVKLDEAASVALDVKAHTADTAPASLATLSASTLEALGQLLRQGESENTVKSYRSAMRYWAAWHQFRLGAPIALPLGVEVVLQFIADHAERQTERGLSCELPCEVDVALVQSGCKAHLGAPAHATLVHRVAVMSKAHQSRQLPNPCQDPRVRELMARVRRGYARRGQRAQKKEAITKDVLQKLLDTCDDSPRGLRDRALLLFAWSSGGRRRAEVAAADMRFLQKIDPPQDDAKAHTDAPSAPAFVYELLHSKTNQSGAERADSAKPVLGAAAVALQRWLDFAGIDSGPIFRRIRKGGQVGEGLSPQAVRLIVRERCTLAGVEGDFSAHSLRSGFVTEAARRNVPLAQTMAMTGHSSVATVMGYFRHEAAVQNPAARLMDEDD